ncbi:unnamed protein product [Orchesella dallaii]|uniref:Uncharacterized protein n=1 Tax=Orchesella dallaii TaxID=48710 RepID=A0ABP1Q9C9_9HEXA
MKHKRVNPLIVHSYSFVFIFLLYEARFGTSATPLHVSETLSFPQANSYKSALVMPVWARKAGGNWRPELLQEIDKETILNSKDLVPDQDDTLDSYLSGAKRTGVTSTQLEEEEKNENEGQDETDEDDYVDDDWDAEEPECEDGMYYHVRGKRCVPLRCPGGNTWRDRDTGECILKHYRSPYRNRWRSSRPWRPYRRTIPGRSRGGWALFGR